MIYNFPLKVRHLTVHGENFSVFLTAAKKTVQCKKNTVSCCKKGKSMNQEFTAPKKAGRLDSFISEQSGISRSKIKKYIESGKISVNGAVCTDTSKKLTEGDRILLTHEEEASPLQAAENELTVYYQDEYLAVIEKKAGLTVHPCPSCREETLVNHLLYHFPSLRKMEGERPGIVHRLDKDTSGLMLIALTEESRLRLSEAFCEKEVQKTYLALVQGICPNGESTESIGRHPTVKTKMALVPVNKGGREARSAWERLYPGEKQIAAAKMQEQNRNDNFSLVKVRIYTGRTHQIRVHLTAFGYPLLGDALYAPAKTAEKAPRQMLHAYKLSFCHPFTGEELSFTSLPPADFWQCLDKQLKDKQQAVPLIVTGNSGSGKSALLEIAKRQNLPTFSADACIAELYKPGGDAWYLLRQQYGTQFVPDDTLPADKKALAKAMQNPSMKQELENLLHPLVYSRMADFFGKNANAPLAVAEIPLWFESKPVKLPLKPAVLAVTCSEEIRRERLQKRGWNEETIAYMDGWQLPQEEKKRLADYAVINDGSLEQLEKEFLSLIQKLIKQNASAAAAILEDIKQKLA